MAIRSLGLFLQRQPEAEDEDEQEEQNPNDWTIAEERCMACGDPLHYTEEAVLVSVNQPLWNGSQVVVTPVLVQDGEHAGDFFFEPLFFEFDCWENLAESLREMVEDAPPIRHEMELLSCSFCECSICEWEIYATAHVGELHVSQRMPNAEVASKFESIAKPYIVCLGCLDLLNTHEIDLWDRELNQIGECQECTHVRCWRSGECSCPCHSPNESEDEETT